MYLFSFIVFIVSIFSIYLVLHIRNSALRKVSIVLSLLVCLVAWLFGCVVNIDSERNTDIELIKAEVLSVDGGDLGVMNLKLGCGEDVFVANVMGVLNVQDMREGVDVVKITYRDICYWYILAYDYYEGESRGLLNNIFEFNKIYFLT